VKPKREGVVCESRRCRARQVKPVEVVAKTDNHHDFRYGAKSMTPEKMVELSGSIATKMARLGELVRKEEDGKLSRREAAELTTVRGELQELRRELQQPDPRQFQPGARSSRVDHELAGDTLTPEQRISDWLRERGDYRSSSSIGDGDGEKLSVGKMIRGAVTGNWRDAEAEQRAMSENVLANGGYALAPDLSARVIDRVRNNMAVMQLGATTVPMLTQQMYLARLAGGADVSWKTEGAAITESSPTFERVTLTAKTLPCLVRISAELFEDLSPEATDTIERELSLALSLELDRAALRGSGVDPEPTGIRNAAGVTVTSLGANGASPTWDNMIDAVATVQASNIEPDGIIWASRTAQTFSKQKDLQNRYLEPPTSLAGIKRVSSNQIPVNLTTGTNSDTSEIYLGRWSDVLVGLRTDLRFQVRVLDERYIDNLQYGLLVYLRADIALAHPQAFNVVTGVRP
jgi:HK97 family phage major capsid protein